MNNLKSLGWTRGSEMVIKMHNGLKASKLESEWVGRELRSTRPSRYELILHLYTVDSRCV